MKESQRTEFKRHLKGGWLKLVSAFVLDQNRRCIDDQGQAFWIEKADKLPEDIPNKVRNILGIVVDVNLVMHDNLEALHIEVPAYQMMHVLRTLMANITQKGWSIRKEREQILKIAATVAVHAWKISVHIGEFGGNSDPACLKACPGCIRFKLKLIAI